MNAIEFCKKLDNELGEIWSNEYQELPERMEEYAKLYHEQQLKILNIPVVNQRSELLKAFLDFQQNKYSKPYDTSISEQIADFEAFNCG